MGGNIANLSSPCALCDLAPRGHNQKVSAKLHKVHSKVTLQPQILAQGLDDKTRRQTAYDRKLFYLMQNWRF